MRHRSLWPWTWLVGSLFLGVVGCGKKTTDVGSQGDGAPRGGREVREIAVMPKATVAEFWLTVKAGAEKAAEESGVKILWKGPAQETDVAGQIAILEDFVSQGIDGIVLAACDAKALVDPVKRAKEKGIPVVTIDSGLDPDVSDCFVATDNVEGARKAAETLIELIGGEGEVGLLPFVPGAATSQLREQGFKEGIAGHPKVKLVATLYSQSDVGTAVRVTEDMLTANPGIRGIFAANEPGAMGCAQVLEERGLAGKIKLVAFDAADEEIAALEKGVIQALIVQNPFRMGYEGVLTCVKRLNGEPVEQRIDTGVTVVTKDNLSDPEIQKLLHPLTAD